MHCSEFEQRMQELLDERRGPEEDPCLIEHAGACQPCSELLFAQQQLFNVLRNSNQPPLPNDFAERVISTSVTHRRLRAVVPLLVTATLAASLLVILLPALRPGQRSQVSVLHGRQFRPVAAASAAGLAHGPEVNPEQYRVLIQGLILQMHRLPRLEQVDRIAGSIRPLASTLNVAIDMLWRSTFSSGWDSRSGGDQNDSASVFRTRRMA